LIAFVLHLRAGEEKSLGLVECRRCHLTKSNSFQVLRDELQFVSQVRGYGIDPERLRARFNDLGGEVIGTPGRRVRTIQIFDPSGWERLVERGIERQNRELLVYDLIEVKGRG